MRLAQALADEMRARGCAVDTETIRVARDWHRWLLPIPLLPLLPRYLASALFRIASRLAFGRPLADFTLDGAVGKAALRRFCDSLCPDGDAATSRSAPCRRPNGISASRVLRRRGPG
ncbi:MAG: hypothetical protein ACK4SR_10565 [Thiobacillus sp.]